MASFNTVAGCVLASALFAMVVGKVSNALVHPHKLEKPAIAVLNGSPTDNNATLFKEGYEKAITDAGFQLWRFKPKPTTA